MDYPNADLNFAYRLEQLTAIKTDPDVEVVQFTNDKLKNTPFVLSLVHTQWTWQMTRSKYFENISARMEVSLWLMTFGVNESGTTFTS